MKRMRLVDLLYKISDSVTVWISEDPSVSTGIYFGFVGDIQLKTAMGYDVVEVYPESYPAIYGFTGITVIVKKVEEE